MHSLRASEKGSSLVLGTVMLIIVTLIGGIFFYNHVMGSINFATNTYNTQMQMLLLDSARINGTHIIASLKNVGTKDVSITNAYVNNIPALLSQSLQLAPAMFGTAFIGGSYSKGTTYTVKLAGLFGTLITFDITF